MAWIKALVKALSDFFRMEVVSVSVDTHPDAPLEHPLEHPQEAPQAPVEPITPIKQPKMTNAEKLYQTAVQSLHKDMSPLDKAPDSLACMESVDGVWLAAFGEHLLPLESRLSTNLGYKAMLKDKRLQKVEIPVPGCIVISPTGYSTKGAAHGHTGIVGNYDIMSNDSNSGLFLDNYSKAAWVRVFHDTLGFPVAYFLPK